MAPPNADIHNACNQSDSDTVHISSPVRNLKKLHLQGSGLFNLQNLCNVIKIVSEHSVKSGTVIDLISEVQHNGLA